MSTKLVLPAPAKLNLFLHIIGRREDGYHQLQTLFQFLDYGDELSFASISGSNRLTLSSNIPDLDNDHNLIIKAARLLQTCPYSDSSPKGACITLNKKLPMGGGVGGGSSDAATTLLALNALWQLGLSMDKLAELGLQLGADVPVFVRGFSAYAEGVGEELLPVSPEQHWYLVLVPDVHVDTTRMFKHPELTRDTLPIQSRAALEQSGQNDFEPLVRRLYPQVEYCLSLLEGCSGTGMARMSGSGACVFKPFDSRQQALDAQNELKFQSEATLTSFVAQGKNLSPMHAVLKDAGYLIPG